MPQRVAEVIRAAAERLNGATDTPRLDAEILLAHVRGVDRSDLLTGYGKEVSDPEQARFDALVARRLTREPVAYIVGRKYFFEDEFFVDRRVLIPRPDTEHLVEEALRLLRYRPEARILDLCCGSGCIGLTLARFTDADITLADLSPDALAVARLNAERLFSGKERRFHLIESDIFAAITGTFDLIAVNPPYLTVAETDALAGTPGAHEPRMAFDGGPDGFAVSRRILADAYRFLKPGGHLLMELGFLGAPMARTARTELRLVDIVKDYAGIERVAVFTT
ncbi:MAG TPA: peptide chain release factor N(5)-glutamine methyltransferase [bacterium]|nr:peptide chain release factor N(5)-glutamine methyltransferase [bacterium]